MGEELQWQRNEMLHPNTTFNNENKIHFEDSKKKSQKVSFFHRSDVRKSEKEKGIVVGKREEK